MVLGSREPLGRALDAAARGPGERRSTPRRCGCISTRPRGFHGVSSGKFEETFGPSAEGRRVGATLLHPPPTNDDGSSSWVPRWCDLDVLGHVNNAAYWTAVLEKAATRGLDAPYRAEIEHRAAVSAGVTLDTPVSVDADGTLRMWFVNEAGLCASALVGPEFATGAMARGDGG